MDFMKTLNAPSIGDDFLIWYNGNFINRSELKLDVLTNSLHYATSVFEGQKAYGGKVFKLLEHTERLLYSAKTLGMKVSFRPTQIIEATNLLLSKQDIKNGYVRPLIWLGPESLKMGSTINSINIMIAAWSPNAESLEDSSDKGLNIILSPWVKPQGNSMPYKAKTSGSYLTANMSKQQAFQQGYDDALIIDYRGFVAECTVSNIFFVKEGKLYTPLPDCFLNGITKQTIETIAKDNDICVIEKHIPLEDISNFEECFSCGTAVEIKKISSITLNDRKVEYKTHNLTEFIQAEYKKLIYA